MIINKSYLLFFLVSIFFLSTAAQSTKEVLRNLAIQATYHDDFDSAIFYYNNLEIVSPNDSLLFFDRAICYQLIGNNKIAKIDLTKHVNLFPNEADAYFLRAEIEFELEEDSLALYDIQNFLKRESKNSDAHLLLGRIYYNIEKYHKGFKEFKKALKLNPNSELARIYCASYYILKGSKNKINKIELFESASAEYKTLHYLLIYLKDVRLGRIQMDKSLLESSEEIQADNTYQNRIERSHFLTICNAWLRKNN